jgi:putative CocE/NonD family hydrolase
MVIRDTRRLDADVYRPEEERSFPVLLMRQPYGRAIASTVVYAHPTWYASSHSYIVALQDVLGRGTSEGKFELFDCPELSDEFDPAHGNSCGKCCTSAVLPPTWTTKCPQSLNLL